MLLSIAVVVAIKMKRCRKLVNWEQQALTEYVNRKDPVWIEQRDAGIMGKLDSLIFRQVTNLTLVVADAQNEVLTDFQNEVQISSMIVFHFCTGLLKISVHSRISYDWPIGREFHDVLIVIVYT